MPSLFSAEVVATQVARVQRLAQLPAYNDVLEQLVRATYQENVQIGFWQQPRSKLTYSFTASGEPYGFWITLKEIPLLESRRDVLYDLMHELGHYRDNEERPVPGVPRDAAAEKRREVRAWAFADQQFNTFPELRADEAEYAAYKARCLASYPGSA